MSEKPHIVYIITRAERGGAQMHVAELLALRDRARLTVVAGEEGFLLAEARGLGLATHVLPDLRVPLRPARDWQALRAMVRLLRQLRPDLVHLHSSKAGLLGRVAAARLGIPAVFTVHGWAFTEGVSWPRRLLTYLAERVTAPLLARAITVSEYDRQLALRLRVLPASRLVTIHNGLPEVPSGQPGAGAPSSRPPSAAPVRAIMAARFSPQKDQALLIRAVREVPDLELWLVGEGEQQPAAEALVAALGLTERVHFLGDRGDVPALLRQSELFCLSTHYEGFPISILEAMRAGLPVLASDVGGVGEAVVPEVTGLLLPRGDLPAWIQALKRLTTDAALRRQLGEAGQRRFRQQFLVEQMLDQTWEVYRDVWNRQLRGTPVPTAVTKALRP
ncbi:Glycosyl transferase, group 1 family [Deinococcus phoenicis]|uniref:Glycosyl transferase, group 1 family n=1 Tax=Deinococcus phoenicis TaxID=1476583 RepID=A0A016QTN1_9DEIO|nr:glycosyltransferase family 4 protein [Deinococcus phoenicis]EYB69470.1 Glycosyl transferase, group 1 family [Deinococcus phoenicis]